MKRISKEKYYLKLALAASERSTCLRRKYGAIIVKDDIIISTGYNGAPRGEENCDDIGTCYREQNNIPKGEQYEKCRAVHAEQNALIACNFRDAKDSVMYIAGSNVSDGSLAEPEPCLICRKMIKNAGVTTVYGLVSEETVKEIVVKSWLCIVRDME